MAVDDADQLAVVIAEPVLDAVPERLRAAGLRVLGADDTDAASAVGLLVRSSTKVGGANDTTGWLQKLPALRAVATASVGFDNLDLDALRAAGIDAFHAPGTNRDAAADHTLGLLLALVRQIAAADATLRAGGWDRATFRGTELAGKTLGIIGIGNVGSAVCRRAIAFGMTVLAHDPYQTADTLHADARTHLGSGLRLVELDELLTTSDIVTIHTPRNDETRNYLSADRLSQLRPGAIILNVARGGLLDEDALVSHLTSGHIAGAALDVFATEPPPADSPLRPLPTVVLTPHLGGQTHESMARMQLTAADHLIRALLHDDRGASLTG